MNIKDKSVLLLIENHVSRIVLNNPEEGNVVNNDNLPLLHKYLIQSISSKECRVIIIEGKDKVFSRGMDFKNLINNVNTEIKKEFSDPYKLVIKTIRNSPKPVIAKIDGSVLAGGMGIALACDIIISTSSSIFGLSEVLFGIIPAYVFPLLLERVSFKRSRYLVLSSRMIKAKEAYYFGIIDEIVDDDKIDRTIKNYVKRLLYSSPEALELTKKYSDNLFNKKIDESIDYAQEQLTKLLNDKENINGIKSFMEGEKPKWAVSYKKNPT